MDNLSSASPLPRKLLTWNTNMYGRRISNSSCNLKDISYFLSFSNHINSDNMKDCVLNFFRSCVDEALVKKDDVYCLNPYFKDPEKLKAIGYMIALSYHYGYYVGLNLDSELISKTFTSQITFANALPSSFHPTIYRNFSDRCNDGTIEYSHTFSKFKKRVYDGYSYDCCNIDSFWRFLVMYIPASHELWPYLGTAQGRQKVFPDKAILNWESNPELLSNIQQRLWGTEPLSFWNWHRRGLNISLLRRDKRKFSNCLKSLPAGKLQKIFTMVTGLENMPLGGADRIEMVHVTYSNKYEINRQSYSWNVSFDFDCEEFKRNFDLD